MNFLLIFPGDSKLCAAMNFKLSCSHLKICLLLIFFASSSNGLTFSNIPERRGPNSNSNNNLNNINNNNMLSSLGPLPSGSGRQSAMLQNCATAIGSGSLDNASPFCRAWLLAMFRNRNEDVQRLMELSAPDTEAQRGIHEMKVFFLCWLNFRVNLLPFLKIHSTNFRWFLSTVQLLFWFLIRLRVLGSSVIDLKNTLTS